MENEGRYLRVDMEFAGSPARSARVCGKMVTGDDVLGAVQLSREEELRLGIGGRSGLGNRIDMSGAIILDVPQFRT